ncbi:unnamed protein product [Parnassius apollo]|uniref:(apollo) hypothetical protein n=1 Tax=Parnassius apollo TaxID=110799 RepID=A0A8S3Y3E8_PARAO|nr:unnamed protein product [Parnassius apollo]
MRSNTFDVTELERLRREAVPSSGENAAAEDAAPQLAEQTANVDAAVNTPVVVDSNDDGTVAQELELEQMRSTLEEAIVETRSTTLENRPRLPRLALRKRNRAVVRALNPMLVTYLEASLDLCDTDSILFGAALAVCRIIGAKLSTARRATGQSSAIPAWRIRIEERIAKARALIGRLICFRSGNTRPSIVRTVRMAFAGTNVSLSQPDIMQKLTERIDDLKQRIAAWGKRIRRYTERSTRFNQNRLFQSDQKRLYKTLERPVVSGTGPAPNQADMVAFWRSLWSEPVNHNEGPWTEVVASQCASITPMDPVIITPDDVAEAVRRAPNWKSPGLDGLHHYYDWLKGFMVCHSVLARQFQEALNQKSLPSLFTTGITHLVPKDQGATDPSKYRPITNLRKEISITCSSREECVGEEVENYYKKREKTVKTKTGNEIETGQSKKRGRPMGSKNKKKKKQRDPAPSEEVLSTENDSENNEVVDTVEHGEEGDGNELKSQNIGGHAKFVVEAMIHRPPSPEIAEDLYMLDIGDNLSVLQEQEVEPPVIITRDFTIGESEEQILWEDKDLPIVEEYVVEPSGDLTASTSHKSGLTRKENNTEKNDSVRDLVKDAYFIFSNEGSRFLGQIRKVNLSTATVMVSAFQKSFLGGWKWPSKAEILKVKVSDIVSIVKEHQISKKGGITYIEDEILFMEWGE